MFFKMIARNSKRSRKENGLFFSSLIISIVAFYMILSLAHQDVMFFLMRMESDAVNKLMTMIPVFYGMTLFILFFLVYYASKYQLERRRHEFGVYLMLGMRRIRLFAMLLAEDLRSNIISLAIGLPTGILLSELISLITARLVGIGIVGHQSSFSLRAALWTTAGFLLIKFAAFLILSGKISRQEIGSLLSETPEGVKKQWSSILYAGLFLLGILCLAAAYTMAIRGSAWRGIRQMGLTMCLGLAGTFAFFQGLRLPMEYIIRRERYNRPLHVFNFRQIQETVIHRSGTLAVCSLLMLSALCCFGAGVAMFRYYGESEAHVLDYTFKESESGKDTAGIRRTLTEYGLDNGFSRLFEMRVGYIRTSEDYDHAFQMEPLMSALRGMPSSTDRDVLLNNLGYATYPHLISLDSYNQLLDAAGMPRLTLDEGKAVVYMGSEFAGYERKKLLNNILKTEPRALVDGEEITLTGEVQTTNLVTDRSITLSFALILPDEVFEYYTQGEYSTYLNGILKRDAAENAGLMSAISDMNQKLNGTGLSYESYLQNMGRQLFYMVSASYITIYLAIIFLIIANTVIGVQFLMGQQKSGRRYQILAHLGAGYDTLCRSSRKQIHWYFGIPAGVAACSSLFGVRSLFAGFLPSAARSSLSEMMMVSAAMILALCVIECMYIAAVRRSGDRYLLTLMVPKREE